MHYIGPPFQFSHTIYQFKWRIKKKTTTKSAPTNPKTTVSQKYSFTVIPTSPSLSSIPNPSHNFHILNPSSILPLQQFIATNPHHASSIAAIVTYNLHPVNSDDIRLLPSLRFICTPSAGTNHIDLSECRRRGIQVADAGNIFSADVADMAVALLIDVGRKISAADRWLRRRIHPSSWF